jgi:putative endonuclease
MILDKRKILGNNGEQFVCDHLEKDGYIIIARNYRKRFGEIDIIAHKQDTLAFIEVKTRSYHFIDPAEIITLSKQKKIIAVAKQFIAAHNYTDTVYRFDVAFIEHKNNNSHLEYLENAFIDESYY